MNKELLSKLLEKYENNTATESERVLIDAWLESISNGDKPVIWSDFEIQNLYSSIKPKSKYLLLRTWLSTAAAILIMAIGGYYFWQVYSPQSYNEVALETVMPNDEAAKIILENGEVIYLDEAKEGLKLDENAIKYEDGTNVLDNQSAVVNLSIYIPKGKKYKVELSDGTKVWLNATTTLKYPSRFATEKRQVELDGEAFFEVASLYVNDKEIQKKVPFEVKTANQVVRVLGTHFNVSSYKNDAYESTTLLEGAVQVVNSFGASKVLLPGQQAFVTSDKHDVAVVKADVEMETSWKNDLFVFRNTSLQKVLQDVERWYDITVDIDKYPKTKFYGEINRNVPLSDVLALIELTSDIKFKLITNGNENKLIMDKYEK